MKCKYCQKEINLSNFNKHLKINHIKEYNEQVQLVKKLFFDDNFSKKTINDYSDVILQYNIITNIWKLTYTKEERKQRMIRCTTLHNKETNKNKKHTDETKKRMSLSRIKYLQEHHQLSIHGFRPDIGHNANSTYEANIYRIFQKENKKYKKETENMFPIIFPDGTQHNYIIDICDVEGLFAGPGTYIEIKGYMDERSRLRINCFKQQYPQYKLIVIGNKYQKNYTPDIDYRMLENKYRVQIPLWETSHDNIKTNPQKWSIDLNQNNKQISQSTFYCPECGIVYGKQVWTHIHHFHSDIYNQIINIIKQLFYDKNFIRNNKHQYKDKICGIGYTTIYREWIKIFGKKYVNNRKKMLKQSRIKIPKAFIDCPICGKVHSKWLFTHIKDNHEKLYNEIMNAIKELFYDKNFVQANIDQYKDKLYGINYTSVYTQWKKIYGKEIVSQRTILLQHPHYLNIKHRKTLNSIRGIPSAAHECSICGEKNINRIMNHIKFKHPEKYDQLIKNCETIFYDKTFGERTCDCQHFPQLYGISYNTVKRQWIKKYGKNAVSNRMKMIKEKEQNKN